MKKSFLLIIFLIILSTKVCSNASSFHPFTTQPQINYPPNYIPNYSTIKNTPYSANPNYTYNKSQKRLYQRYLKDQQLLNRQYYKNTKNSFWQNLRNNVFTNGTPTGISPIIPTDSYYYNDPNYYYY